MRGLREKLFLFSLEGALCGPEGGIAPTNAEMLRLLTLRGGRYTVISDRTPEGVRNALRGLPLPGGPVLCSDGAVLFDLEKNECLQRTELSRPDAETLLWTLERAFPSVGLGIQIYGGPVQIIRANSYTEEYLRVRGFGGILIQLEYIPDHWLNASVFADSQQLSEIEDYIAQKKLTGDFTLVRRTATQLQILPKVIAFQDVMTHLYDATGVLAQDVYGMGGMAGDAAWLGFVGKSAAAADAASDVKLAADSLLLCTSAEGAAAEFLYQSMKQYE